MKKNKMMRVASALLVAVLLSTCAISGTFAKYVATGSGSDSARVAKWGVAIETENFSMFTKEYATNDATATFEGAYSVQSSNSDNVLAPGTKGEFANIAITGTPEVAVEVAVVPTVTLSDNWTVNGEFYCPVTITVGDTVISGLDYENAVAFTNAVKNAIEGNSAQYALNTDLSTKGDDTNLDLAWYWGFEGTEGGKQTDIKDTALGDVAAKGDELKIGIDVAISVTQID